ncbi:MAG: hypothetical protein OEM93_23460 [Rhodospirillales bacterium]|nr:hypothetical protein [Rhodospirillales bacterium]
MRSVLGLMFCTALALSSPAAAQDGETIRPRLTLGPNAGTLGLGNEAGLRLSDHFGLRFGANHAPLDAVRERLDTDIDVTPTAAGAVLDYYPFQGGFRLSGGLRYNAEGPDSVVPAGGITIGGLPFTPSQTGMLRSGSDFIGYAPYGGVGLQSSFWEGRLELAFDLGVYYQGNSRADLNGEGISGEASADTSPASGSSTSLEEDPNFLGFYPIVGFTAKYRF